MNILSKKKMENIFNNPKYFFSISLINCCEIFNDMVFNRSEARTQKNKLSSCTCTRISNKTRLIGPFMKFK